MQSSLFMAAYNAWFVCFNSLRNSWAHGARLAGEVESCDHFNDVIGELGSALFEICAILLLYAVLQTVIYYLANITSISDF